MKRALVLLPTTGYRNSDFLAAAAKLEVQIIAAADFCHQLAPIWGMAPILSLHFDQPELAADQVLEQIGSRPDAVLAVDDSGVELAALLAERLGLGGNPAAAVRRVRDKLAFRQLLAGGGFRCPAFQPLADGDDPHELARHLQFPVVAKARRLSASRGVIRADGPEELVSAIRRVRAIQANSDRDAAKLGIVIEDFIPGTEHALEAVLEEGELTTLALFDKPDPLDGPYFEETIYVTPSRLPGALQERVRREVARACAAAGLITGPVHAEVRVNADGVWILEIAARSIGGLCGRVLTHALGMSLEELILRQALGEPVPLVRAAGAAGVMMIPIPRRGIYRDVEGLDCARSVPGITGITITAQPGQIIAPPPDGASYLGFMFSGTQEPAEAEAALRKAHSLLGFDIQPEYPAAKAPATERS